MSLPPKYLDYADYLVNFELFYRNIRNLGILSNENLDFVKTRTKEAALSLLIKTVITMFRKIFLKKNFLLYKFFVKIKKIVIQKSGKSNSVVIVNKADYLDKIENLLNGM